VLLYILLWMYVFVVSDFVFQYLAKRLAGKKVSKMTYFVSTGSGM